MVALSHPQPGAVEHPAIAQMRVTCAAQATVDGIEFADLTDPGNKYERLNFALMDEVATLRRVLAEAGICAVALREALS